MFNESLFDGQTEYAVQQYAIEKGKEEEAARVQKKFEKMIRGLLALKALSVAQISKVTGWKEDAIQEIKDSMEELANAK